MIRWVMMCVVMVVLCGCRVKHEQKTTWHDDDQNTTNTPPPPERDTRVDPIRNDARELDKIARQIQGARDGIEEGAALKKLQVWQADRGTTFQVSAVRGDNVKPVKGKLSTMPDPLRTTVTIFRGQQPIYTLTFVPQDNRNLALIGQ